MVRRSSVMPDDESTTVPPGPSVAGYSRSQRCVECHRAGALADGIGIEPKPAAALSEAGACTTSARTMPVSSGFCGEAILPAGGACQERGPARHWGRAAARADAGSQRDGAMSWPPQPPTGSRQSPTALGIPTGSRGWWAQSWSRQAPEHHDPVTAGPDHADALEELAGEWSLDRPHRQAVGPLGTAYLEALPRAAGLHRFHGREVMG